MKVRRLKTFGICTRTKYVTKKTKEDYFHSGFRVN